MITALLTVVSCVEYDIVQTFTRGASGGNVFQQSQGQFLTYTKVKAYVWGFRKYKVDFLEFLKNILHMFCKSIEPHSGDSFPKT